MIFIIIANGGLKWLCFWHIHIENQKYLKHEAYLKMKEKVKMFNDIKRSCGACMSKDKR